MAKNVYIELAFSTLNLDKFNKAWDNVIARYPALSEHVEPYVAQHFDLREYNLAKIKQVQSAIRKKLQTTPLDKKTWFSFITTQYNDNITCVHIAITPDFLTGKQIYHLLREWQTLYENPKLSLETVELNTAENETVFLSKPLHRYYEHFLGKLDHKTFAELRANSEKEHTSLPLALAGVFRDELDRQERHFPIYLTLANRFPLFPHMYDRASFATSVNLFPLKFDEQGTFAKRCQTLETNLRQASLNFKPEMSKTISLKNKEPLALFTCTLDQDLPHAPMSTTLPHILYANIDLPLVAVELQAWQTAGQLFYRWSYLTEHSEEETIPSTDIVLFKPDADAEFDMNNLSDKKKKITDVREFDAMHFLKQRVAQHEFDDIDSEDDNTTPQNKEHVQTLAKETDDVMGLTSLMIKERLHTPKDSGELPHAATVAAEQTKATQQLAAETSEKKSSGVNVAAIAAGAIAAGVAAAAAANTTQNAALNLSGNNMLPPLQMPIAAQNNAGLMPVQNNPNIVPNSNITPAAPAMSDSLKNTFGNLSKSITQLATGAGAWAAQKVAANNSSTFDEQAYQNNLDQLPPDSPAVAYADT